MQIDRTFGQAILTEAARDLAGQHATDGAVRVAHGNIESHRLTPIERWLEALDQHHVECGSQAMVLFDGLAHLDAGLGGGGHQHVREVELGRLPMRDVGLLADAVDLADHLLDGAEAERRHDLARLFGNVEHEADDVLGLPVELGTQHRILRGDAHRTGVEVALSHHDAARSYERRGGKAELFGAQQSGEHDVAPRWRICPSRLQEHATAQNRS